MFQASGAKVSPLKADPPLNSVLPDASRRLASDTWLDTQLSLGSTSKFGLSFQILTSDVFFPHLYPPKCFL